MGIDLYLIATPSTRNNQLSTETTSGTTTTYSYDGNGNLLSRVVGGNTTSYSWNWRNYLLSVSQAGGSTSYEYDGAGTRISKTQSGVKTKYINDLALPLVQVLMETNNAGTIQTVYTYGNDLISMKRSSANSYYHYDGLGSARQLTNSAGSVTVSYMYDSFGNLIASTGTSANTYGFTGEQQFGEADGLVFLRARYYKPSIGRFISRDPIGYEAGLNLYTYVKNNPINLVDPYGLRKQEYGQTCEKKKKCFSLKGVWYCPEQSDYSRCTDCCDYMANVLDKPPWWKIGKRCDWFFQRGMRFRNCYIGCFSHVPIY